jgi:hypothetical protein
MKNNNNFNGQGQNNSSIYTNLNNYQNYVQQ